MECSKWSGWRGANRWHSHLQHPIFPVPREWVPGMLLHPWYSIIRILPVSYSALPLWVCTQGQRSSLRIDSVSLPPCESAVEGQQQLATLGTPPPHLLYQVDGVGSASARGAYADPELSGVPSEVSVKSAGCTLRYTTEYRSLYGTIPSAVSAPTHASSLPLGQLCCSRVFAPCCWCCTLHTSATRVPLGTSTPGSTAADARLCRVHSLLAGVASPAHHVGVASPAHPHGALLHSDAVWACGGGGGAEPQKAEGLRAAYARVLRSSTQCTPWLHMLRLLACLQPLRYTAYCCAGDATSPRACVRTRCTRGALRPCGVHTTCMRCNARHYVPLCYAQAACLRMQTHAVHVYVHVVHVVATLPRARMLRPLACSLHECLHANDVSLLATDTQACCAVPAGGQQQLRGIIGSKVLRSMHRCPLSMCMLEYLRGPTDALVATTPPLLLCIRRALLLSHLPPLSLVGHSSSAHYPLPVTMVFGPSSGCSSASRCLAGPNIGSK